MIEWNRESFATEAEAEAFAAGLEYGDEPQWAIDAVEPCRHQEDTFDVVFAYADDVEMDNMGAPKDSH